MYIGLVYRIRGAAAVLITIIALLFSAESQADSFLDITGGANHIYEILADTGEVGYYGNGEGDYILEVDNNSVTLNTLSLGSDGHGTLNVTGNSGIKIHLRASNGDLTINKIIAGSAENDWSTGEGLWLKLGSHVDVNEIDFGMSTTAAIKEGSTVILDCNSIYAETISGDIDLSGVTTKADNSVKAGSYSVLRFKDNQNTATLSGDYTGGAGVDIILSENPSYPTNGNGVMNGNVDLAGGNNRITINDNKTLVFGGDLSATGGSIIVQTNGGRGYGSIAINSLAASGGNFNFSSYGGAVSIGTAYFTGNTIAFQNGSGVNKINYINVDSNGGTLQGYGSSITTYYNTTVASSGVLTVNGFSSANLGSVSGDGTIDLQGTGTKYLKGSGLNKLQLSGTGTVYASAQLNVTNLDVDADVTLSTNGTNTIQASNTDILNGKTLNTSGNGIVRLGTVTGGGSVTFGGTGAKYLSGTGLAELQVDGASTVNTTGTLTVNVLDINAATTLATAGNNVTVSTGSEISGGTLTVSGNGAGAVNLGAVTTGAGGGLTIDGTAGAVTLGSVALGAGTFTLTNNKAGNVAITSVTTTANGGELAFGGSSNGNISVGTMTISNNVTLNAGLDYDATNTVVNNGFTLSTAGDRAVDLGTVSGTGTVNFGGTSEKSLKGSIGTLQVSGACNVNTSAALTVSTLDIDAATTLATGGNNVTVNTSTTISGGALTITGAGSVSLGAVSTGAGGGLTIAGTAGAVTLNSVSLGSGTFTMTNNKAGNVSLAAVTTTANGGELAFSGNAGVNISVGTMTVSNNITLNTGLAYTATNTVVNNGFTLATNGGSAVDLGTVSGTGSVIFAGSGDKSLKGSIGTLQLGETCRVNSTDALTVGTLDIDANVILATDGANLVQSTNTDIANGVILETSGDSAVNLGTLTGSGIVNFSGTGDKSLKGVSSVKLQISEACTLNATGVLTAGILDIDEDTEIIHGLNEISFSNLEIASEKKLTISGGANSSFNGITGFAAGSNIELSGLGVTNFAGIVFSGSNSLTVDSGVTANFTAGVDLTSTDDCKIILDFGDDEGVDSKAAVGSYAKLTGVSNLTVSKSDTAIEQIFGVNGIAGLTYEGVFDEDNADIQAGNILSTDDDVRIYRVADNLRDVLVTVAGNREEQKIKNGGGSGVAAKAGQDLIDQQKDLNEQGKKYVEKFSNLDGVAAARAAAQSIGEQDTIQTAQTAITTITAAVGSVENQMVKFRSGKIAKGLASSFGVVGFTSAVSGMADSSELAQAYEEGLDSDNPDNYAHDRITVWSNGFGGFGEQGSVDHMTGYSFWNSGTIVGIDYTFNRELRAGALLGYSYNYTNTNHHLGNSIDNALRFGGYSSYNFDNIFVDLSATTGVHLIKSTRYIWDGTTTEGERTGIDLNVNSKFGYGFMIADDVFLTPSYSLSYTFFNDPEFTETGSGVSNVSYASFSSNSLVQDIGVNIGRLCRISDNLAFLPEVWGGWEYEYLDTGGTRNTTTSASLGANTYTTEMNSMANNRGYYGAGVTALIGENVSVYGRFDHKIWNKGYNINFLVGVKVSF